MTEENCNVNAGTQERILEELKELTLSVNDLKNKIFVGNGQESLIDRINRNTMITKGLIWGLGVIYAGLVTGVITVLVKKLG